MHKTKKLKFPADDFFLLLSNITSLLFPVNWMPHILSFCLKTCVCSSPEVLRCLLCSTPFDLPADSCHLTTWCQCAPLLKNFRVSVLDQSLESFLREKNYTFAVLKTVNFHVENDHINSLFALQWFLWLSISGWTLKPIRAHCRPSV